MNKTTYDYGETEIKGSNQVNFSLDFSEKDKYSSD